MMHDATGPNDSDTIEGTDTDQATDTPDLAIDPLEQAVTTIQKREHHEGRRQDGDAA